MQTLLDEEVLVVVCEKFELYASFLQERVPSQARTRVVVGRVKTILLLAGLSEGLKDISQKERVYGC